MGNQIGTTLPFPNLPEEEEEEQQQTKVGSVMESIINSIAKDSIRQERDPVEVINERTSQQGTGKRLLSNFLQGFADGVSGQPIRTAREAMVEKAIKQQELEDKQFQQKLTNLRTLAQVAKFQTSKDAQPNDVSQEIIDIKKTANANYEIEAGIIRQQIESGEITEEEGKEKLRNTLVTGQRLVSDALKRNIFGVPDPTERERLIKELPTPDERLEAVRQHLQVGTDKELHKTQYIPSTGEIMFIWDDGSITTRVEAADPEAVAKLEKTQKEAAQVGVEDARFARAVPVIARGLQQGLPGAKLPGDPVKQAQIVKYIQENEMLILSEKQQEAMEAFGALERDVDLMHALAAGDIVRLPNNEWEIRDGEGNSVVQSTGVSSRINGAVQAVLAAGGDNPEARVLQAFSELMLPRIRRAVGRDVGNIAQSEQEMVRPMLFQRGDTVEELALKKFVFDFVINEGRENVKRAAFGQWGIESEDVADISQKMIGSEVQIGNQKFEIFQINPNTGRPQLRPVRGR